MTLSAAGFVPRTLDEIRTELEAAFRAAFGDNVQIEASSVFGQIIAIMAERFADLEALTELIYSSAFVDGATGSSLDDLAALMATVRPAATYSTVTLTLGGTPATAIVAGSIAEDAEGIQWITQALATIGGGGTVDVEARPATTGPIVGRAGTITTIATPIAGWSTVTNALDADVGRAVASDSELRTLIRLTARSGGGSSLEGLRAQLLRLDGVTEVEIAENASFFADSDGRPPHSFEAVVIGGTDQEIADQIWYAKPAGIQTVGTETVVVVDAAGDNQNVNFSRVVDVNVWIEVDYTPGDGFPSDGAAQILEALLDYGDTFLIGQDVLAIRLLQKIEVEGLDDMEIRIGTAVNPLNDNPIRISRTQRAVFDSSRITITEV
jgi:uncharacterized phage protein gp47/JayE